MKYQRSCERSEKILKNPTNINGIDYILYSDRYLESIFALYPRLQYLLNRPRQLLPAHNPPFHHPIRPPTLPSLHVKIARPAIRVHQHAGIALFQRDPIFKRNHEIVLRLAGVEAFRVGCRADMAAEVQERRVALFVVGREGADVFVEGDDPAPG